MHDVKNDVVILKDDVYDVKNDVAILKSDVHILQDGFHELQDNVLVLKDGFHELQNDVLVLKDDTQFLRHEAQSSDNRLSRIELTLENETNRGIKIIAEGHLDLNRKLNDALKVENEKELLLLRVTHLETEMQLVKAQLNQSA